ncbi:Receptor-like protein kinase [Quillaja saponaria]|uniref:Receptor-like protein kinase n=1 Tax=Quillaja saponaria TaxID=32244 RepID=A0AAD7PVT6_QUISA|nr:Receptor-like protein kinase [Quillaja saponaria]
MATSNPPPCLLVPPPGPVLYKFSDVKKMTNSFIDELGRDDFGAVYKGKLPNGCPVAVKLLDASKWNQEDFVNEVSSISRTLHVNIVALLGFCLEGNRKALIYEFMPNGSLANFISDDRIASNNTSPPLSWEKLQKIALGIAQGILYLHQGCDTRILHLDIKPQNILLDEFFSPKIFDFGLAKLCPNRESVISMTQASGTIGYTDSEVWNRNFGISNKSVVYSYGIMILEMIGGRKNMNAAESHSSQMHFPELVYNHLVKDSNFRINDTITSEDNEIAKKMVLVGLWCIQTTPSYRPSISAVIEFLEGNMESLQVPPNPFLPSQPTERSSTPPTSSSLDVYDGNIQPTTQTTWTASFDVSLAQAPPSDMAASNPPPHSVVLPRAPFQSSSLPPRSVPPSSPPSIIVHPPPASISASHSVRTPYTPPIEEANFQGLGKIKKVFIPLLEEAISQQPHLWTSQEGSTMEYRRWAYSALGRVLHFLRNVKIKDLTVEKKVEFDKLWGEMDVFNFDLTWLVIKHDQVMNAGIDEEMLKVAERKYVNSRARDQ